MKFIYCRGGDKTAPEIAKKSGMLYGVRWNYTHYDDVYMLDAGLKTRWNTYKKKARKMRPHFALTPDFEEYRDIETIKLYLMDLRELQIPLIGITPKFHGALSQIPSDNDIVICISIPSSYSGYLPTDTELCARGKAKYHLLGGDIRAQIREVKRIRRFGSEVISLDGNKLLMKAAHGQIYASGRWVVVNDTTYNNALLSAQNIMQEIKVM